MAVNYNPYTFYSSFLRQHVSWTQRIRSFAQKVTSIWVVQILDGRPNLHFFCTVHPSKCLVSTSYYAKTLPFTQFLI